MRYIIFFWDFELQTDNLVPARWSELVLINNKRIYRRLNNDKNKQKRRIKQYIFVDQNKNQ